MKTCPYCAEQISNDAIKCKFCWEDVSEKTAEINNELSAKIKNHLEFIWYECETTDSNEDLEALVCKHSSKNTLIIGCNQKVNIAFLKIRLRLNDVNKIKIEKKYYEIMNKINSESLITKRYHSIEGKNVVINIEWTFNGYEKKWFWIYIDLIEEEISKFSDYFKEYF